MGVRFYNYVLGARPEVHEDSLVDLSFNKCLVNVFVGTFLFVGGHAFFDVFLAPAAAQKNGGSKRLGPPCF